MLAILVISSSCRAPREARAQATLARSCWLKHSIEARQHRWSCWRRGSTLSSRVAMAHAVLANAWGLNEAIFCRAARARASNNTLSWAASTRMVAKAHIVLATPCGEKDPAAFSTRESRSFQWGFARTAAASFLDHLAMRCTAVARFTSFSAVPTSETIWRTSTDDWAAMIRSLTRRSADRLSPPGAALAGRPVAFVRLEGRISGWGRLSVSTTGGFSARRGCGGRGWGWDGAGVALRLITFSTRAPTAKARRTIKSTQELCHAEGVNPFEPDSEPSGDWGSERATSTKASARRAAAPAGCLKAYCMVQFRRSCRGAGAL
mmetsp:Transcript_8981/g.19258  ORF Transcript_8981/g.19258 Transcript_8981/m.19258 type:complete len:320 (+) Transcript_8981:575-1534(+)